MTSKKRPVKIFILGQGRAGHALKKTLELGGHEALFIPRGEHPKAHCDILFVAVQDQKLVDAIREICAWEHPPPIIAHLSAGTPPNLLSRHLLPAGSIALFHPLAALDVDRPIPLGCTIGIAADDVQTQNTLFDLAEGLALTPRIIAPKDQALYHAAAVFASNLPIALVEIAEQIFTQIGLNGSAAHKVALDLFNSMAANLNQHCTFRNALTGPAKRGDFETIERHQKALDEMPELKAIYAALTVRLKRKTDPGINSARSRV